jgi:ribose transport system substrate-binding protein
MAVRTSSLSVCVAIWLAVATLACKSNPGPAGRQYRFAFVTNNTSAFWNIAVKGMKKAERDLGIRAEAFRPLKGELAEQQRFLEDIMALGFDGVAISPLNPEAMTPLMNRVAARMPVICHDSDAPRSQRRAYVGTDNVEAGRAAGAAALRALGTRRAGKVALFVGRIDMQNAVERRRGIEEALAGSGLEVLPVFLDDADRTRAKKNVEDALARYPDLALAIGIWSYNGPALAGAIRASARADRPAVVAFDEDQETLQAIEDGLIQATVVQKPFEFGYQSMRLLKDLRDGRPITETYDPGIVTVTRQNLREFRGELDRLLGQ